MSEMMVRLIGRSALSFHAQAIEPWKGFAPQGVIPPFDYGAFLRALLLELREPTQEMLDASYDGNEGAKLHWQAMIDEVLS